MKEPESLRVRCPICLAAAVDELLAAGWAIADPLSDHASSERG
ncbi:hypothetical protein [Nocardia sp. NPDC003183]